MRDLPLYIQDTARRGAMMSFKCQRDLLKMRCKIFFELFQRNFDKFVFVFTRGISRLANFTSSVIYSNALHANKNIFNQSKRERQPIDRASRSFDRVLPNYIRKNYINDIISIYMYRVFFCVRYITLSQF